MNANKFIILLHILLV